VLVEVPPSGGSLEIGNFRYFYKLCEGVGLVPPSGGSLEIGNTQDGTHLNVQWRVPPSGGSLEIGNIICWSHMNATIMFPLRGDP